MKEYTYQVLETFDSLWTISHLSQGTCDTCQNMTHMTQSKNNPKQLTARNHEMAESDFKGLT